MTEGLEGSFPGLRREGYEVTSPASPAYNCLAWAAGDTSRWWWPGESPDAYWPEGTDRSETLDAFVQAFGRLGYGACDDPTFEPGVEKVAIYADATGEPTHAARQVENGRWTSKLGDLEDVEHALRSLEGGIYGRVARILKRRREASS